MCGIAGVYAPEHRTDADAIRRMTEPLAHRGPDGEGCWVSRDQRVGLGHRRLAIIDLSPGGAQPMVSPDGRLAVTFNGEIYNYQALRRELAPGWEFKSTSDTEVLLAGYARWGVKLLDRLVGMFGFALWDEQQQHLFLARDRAGEKPVYYAHGPAGFVFASEIKALLAHGSIGPRLGWTGFAEFLRHGYVVGEDTMVEGVKRLLPGHAALVGAAGVKTWRYWQLPAPTSHQASPRVAESDALERKFEHLLGEAVGAQLVADVPVGILLSGGVDSSLIAALAVEKRRGPVRSFTITCPENPQLDESKAARLVADHVGTEHIELEGRIGGPELLPRLARQFDEPLGDSSQIPTYLVSELARQHCKVVLGGDGGDELFGGYHDYNRLLQLTGSEQRWPDWVGNAIATGAQHALPFGVRGRKYLMGFARERSGGPRPTPRLFDEAVVDQLLHRHGAAPVDVTREALAAGPANSVLGRALRRDFQRYLAGDILAKVDRASMLASLEVRAPFLDRDLVEFAFGEVPDALKATATERKILPKRLAQKKLPAGFDLQRKQGFSVPMREWLQGKWGTFMFDVLAQAPADLFRPQFLRRLVDGQREGRSNSEAIFTLTMFELWRREYRVSY